MKILFADDHQMVSEGLTALIEKDPAITEVRRVGDGFEALSLARTFHPDVIVMDLSMPGMNGIEATRQIVADTDLSARVLILSMHADPEFVAEALRVGASGYVVKQAAAEELLEAIKQVADGRTYISPAVAGTVVEKFIRGGEEPTTPPRYTLLSPRERQTLQMLAEGMSVKEIAYKLNLSDKTVHAFRANLMDKLEIDSIAELTKYAVKHGLTTL